MRVATLIFDKPAPVEKLAELFLRFSPQIAVRGERVIFVEIGKCHHLYSEQSFKIRAQILLSRHGYEARIGFGADILDSLTLTLFEKSRMEDLPLVSLLELADPFDRDPVLRKGVMNLIASFQDLGISNLGQFRKLPAGELISRFGVIGRHCHSRAHLAEFISWPLWKPEEIILEKKDFPYFEFYGELEPILFEMKSQLDRIFSRLFARRRRATKIEVQVKCEKVSTHPDFLRTVTFDFFTPQSSPKGTLRIVKERLSKEFERKPILSPIESIQTKVLRSVPFEGNQKNIFHSEEEKQEEISSIHNQLVELLGRENIFQAVLTEDRRPERSWKKKFDNPHTPEELRFDISELIPERATYICKPLKIEITAGFVHIKKKRYRILHWDNNVEKISGGWYEKPVPEIKDTFDRNYYQVTLEGKQKITVFETPSREFYLHGYYG